MWLSDSLAHGAQFLAPTAELLGGLTVDGLQRQQRCAAGLQHRRFNLMSELTEPGKLAITETQYRKRLAGLRPFLAGAPRTARPKTVRRRRRGWRSG
jgi:hypothetical protein